jgi:hypothetical protein
VDPDPGGQKLPTEIEEKIINFMFRSVECSLLWAEGFSCSLDVLNGSLGISKLQFLTGQWRTSTAGPTAKK